MNNPIQKNFTTNQCLQNPQTINIIAAINNTCNILLINTTLTYDKIKRLVYVIISSLQQGGFYENDLSRHPDLCEPVY